MAIIEAVEAIGRAASGAIQAIDGDCLPPEIVAEDNKGYIKEGLPVKALLDIILSTPPHPKTADSKRALFLRKARQLANNGPQQKGGHSVTSGVRP